MSRLSISGLIILSLVLCQVGGCSGEQALSSQRKMNDTSLAYACGSTTKQAEDHPVKIDKSLCVVTALAALSTSGGVNADTKTAQQWYEDGANAVAHSYEQQRLGRGKAKNIILFVGDGMGVSTVTAARILEGQQRGGHGEENLLSFEHFPYTALAKTYNTNQQTPDSAGTMTAMMSGIKTKAGVIGVDSTVIRGDCATLEGAQVATFLEEAEALGLSTGIISTARITHATPAATYAHTIDRNYEDDRDASKFANPELCQDIASQLIAFPYGDGLEVALGGGRRSFLKREEGADPEDGGKGERQDGRDLTQEWLNKYDRSAYVWNKAQFDAIDADDTEHLLGLFNMSHMRYEADRGNDVGGEPSLTEMTEKSINILSKNRKGYFLMVEAGRIDHGHHAGSAYNALTDTIEFSNAVQKAVDMVGDDTLIIVTADHSHVFTIAGYPTRGNPILGKVVQNDASGEPENSLALDNDGLPYTTLGYMNGLGFADLQGETNADARYDETADPGRMDLNGVDTESTGYHQESLVNLGSETHAAEDVVIYATGPGSHLVHGVMEQNVIYHIMRKATGRMLPRRKLSFER
ncbi:MAG: alkaline phosphatase [Porticoccaceae bacterium]|nr:alkaline phosphatase [Porticoccaceae bacterium]